MSVASKKPIINAHAHVFTHAYVPPFLAKGVIAAPLYWLLHIPTIIRLARFYNSIKRWIQFSGFSRKFRHKKNAFKSFISENQILNVLFWFVQWYIILVAFFTLFEWLSTAFSIEDFYFGEILVGFKTSLIERSIIAPDKLWLSLPIVVIGFLFFSVVRKLIVYLFKKLGNLIKILPSKDKIAILERYYNLVQFAMYGQQWRIAAKLRGQYPRNTKFVILPMDMEYMGAGKLKNPLAFEQQHDALVKLKKRNPSMLPFLFIDPRRIVEKGKSFFDYTHENGEVSLNNSTVKNYIEQHGFNGFKIYPALGYYPFQEELLPLWKYAADRQLPIMSHGCIGVIYYRGKIKPNQREHPIFKESLGGGEYIQLIQHQRKNKDFQVNFTHPMNFLCLLEEPLLRIIVAQAKNSAIRELFGYTDAFTPLKHNLNHLKICYAHFGGGEEWDRHFEQDRNTYSQQLNTNPAMGIDFSATKHIPWGRYDLVWKGTDWYSIICSMMMQYPNFYSDISYILSNPKYYPLLRKTLVEVEGDDEIGQNKLRKRVLFGTDFYVVRSQMADKEIMAELRGYLTENEFDLIARENTHTYLFHETLN